jgi:hypothetical protein
VPLPPELPPFQPTKDEDVPPPPYDNGLIFGPLCVGSCYKGEKDMSPTNTKKNDNNVAETNEDDEDDEDEDDVLDVEVIPPGMVKDLRKTYSISVADGWKYLAKFNPGNTYMLCYLNCPFVLQTQNTLSLWEMIISLVGTPMAKNGISMSSFVASLP